MLASCLQAFLSVSVSVSVSGPLRFQGFPALYKKEGKKKSLARYCFLHYFPSLNVFLIFLTRDS
jgi:hypothetical protein